MNQPFDEGFPFFKKGGILLGIDGHVDFGKSRCLEAERDGNIEEGFQELDSESTFLLPFFVIEKHLGHVEASNEHVGRVASKHRPRLLGIGILINGDSRFEEIHLEICILRSGSFWLGNIVPQESGKALVYGEKLSATELPRMEMRRALDVAGLLPRDAA